MRCSELSALPKAFRKPCKWPLLHFQPITATGCLQPLLCCNPGKPRGAAVQVCVQGRVLQEDVEERSSSDHRPCLLDALGTQIQTSGGRLEPRVKPTKGLAVGLFFNEDVKVSQTLHCKCILNICFPNIILIYTQIKGSLWMGWVGVVIF